MKYKVGKLYYTDAILAFVFDVLISMVLGVIVIAAGGAIVGDIDVFADSFAMEIIGSIVGIGVTAWATWWLLGKIPDNKLHNVSLFLFIELILTLPLIVFVPSGTLWVGVVSTILWIMTPYVVLYCYCKKKS